MQYITHTDPVVNMH